MTRFKPTTLIALDSYAAAFCQAVCSQLEHNFAPQHLLLQAQAILYEGQEISLTADLSTAADFTFNLDKLRNKPDLLGATEAKKLLRSEQQIELLRPALIKLLQKGRNQRAIATVQKQGIEVSHQRRIYLLLSAVTPSARGIIIEFARLLRWLLNRRFGAEPYSLEALIFLPGLMLNPEPSDYGSAYALLKELDYSQQPLPILDNHWLLDNCNDQGMQMGSLAENLVSYSDAFVGFLTVEPESVGVLIGDKKVQGKVSAYSTFGYGELVFPASIAIARLNTTLASDIITHAFLTEEKPEPGNKRILLLEAQKFVLSEQYNQALNELEQYQGKPIWQDFKTQSSISIGKGKEYIKQINSKYQQFERVSLLHFKKTLEISREKVQANLEKLLDNAINYWADIKGLNQSVQLLQLMTARNIQSEAEVLTDVPQNLVTEQEKSLAFLDGKLDIVTTKDETQTLRHKMQGYSRQLKRIQEEAVNLTSESKIANNIEAQLAEVREEFTTAEREYQQAINSENEQIRQNRLKAIAATEKTLANNINYGEERLVYLDEQLYKINHYYQNFIDKRQQLLTRYLLIYPVIATLLLLVLSLLAFTSGIWQIWLKGLSWIGIVFFTVWALLFVLRLLDISLLRKRARDDMASLRERRNEAKVVLSNSYNKQLRLKYDLYLQNLRQEIIRDLIQIANQKAVTISETLKAIEGIRKNLQAQHQEEILSDSVMRRSVLSLENIDAYYQTVIASPQMEAEIFAQQVVSRSQVWRMNPQEFQEKLESFVGDCFESLTELSIGNVLLHQQDLIDQDTAHLHLRQLYDTAEPLLMLHRVDGDLEQARSRDFTFWVCADDRNSILSYYGQISPNVTVQITDNSYKLQALTRCLGFPAYLISSIEFYRDCYLRTNREGEIPITKVEEENKLLPDLIPTEMITSEEIRNVWQELLLAIAVGIISQNSDGIYVFKEQFLGRDRRQIAEKLASEFTAQGIYQQIIQYLDTKLSAHDWVYQQIEKFLSSQKNIEGYEKEVLHSLLEDYHPLN